MNAEIEEIFNKYLCSQCKKNTAFLSPVCFSCCKKNHKKACGR